MNVQEGDGARSAATDGPARREARGGLLDARAADRGARTQARRACLQGTLAHLHTTLATQPFVAPRPHPRPRFRREQELE